MSELIARTKALLRRPGGALGTALSAGNILFDTIGRDVRVDETSLSLPRRESSILEHLMRRMGRVVPKTVLEDKIYGLDDELSSMPFRFMSTISDASWQTSGLRPRSTQ